MAALYADLHGAADVFAIAIKRWNEKDDLIHLKPFRRCGDPHLVTPY